MSSRNILRCGERLARGAGLRAREHMWRGPASATGEPDPRRTMQISRTPILRNTRSLIAKAFWLDGFRARYEGLQYPKSVHTPCGGRGAGAGPGGRGGGAGTTRGGAGAVA